MTDWVVAKSPALVKQLNTEPDTLVAYVRHFGKVQENVTSAQVVALDSKGMTIKYIVKNWVKKDVRIPFVPQLASYEDAKKRLEQMKVTAMKVLGMPENPTVSKFEFSPDWWQSTLMLSALAYWTFSPHEPAPSNSAFFVLGTALHQALPPGANVFVRWAVLGQHVAQTAYMAYLCRRYKTGFANTVLYTTTTFIWGFPIWGHFHKLIRSARIESINKGQ